MTTHYYEVALFGDFQPKYLNQVLTRFTQISESARKLHIHEVVFEPIGDDSQAIPAAEPVLLRAHRDAATPSGWEVYSYLKPEPARVHAEATVRSAVYCQVIGNALTFASALGYKQRHQYYKRGYLFRKGNIDIQMFQEERVDAKSGQPIHADFEALWEVEVKSSAPTRNTPETPLSLVIDAILDIQQSMRGLLDLRRKEA